MNNDSFEIGDIVEMLNGGPAGENKHTIRCTHPDEDRYYIGIRGNPDDTRYQDGNVCFEHDTRWVVAGSNLRLLTRTNNLTSTINIKKIYSGNIIKL